MPTTNPSGSYNPVNALLSNGTPNFASLVGDQTQTNVSSNGMLDIWDLPNDLDPYRNRNIIWFDIGHSKVNVAEGHLGPEGHTQTTVTKNGPEKDLFRTPTAIMQYYAALSAPIPGANGQDLPNPEFLALQKQLASGPWGTVHETGQFDLDTEKALGNAMAQWYKLSHGAGVPMDFRQYLTTYSGINQALGGDGSSIGGGSQRQAPVYQTTDPESIRQAATSAAQAALGQGLSDKQLSKFVAQFQASQIAYQKAAPGSTVSSPDLSSQAMQFAQGSNPAAYHDTQRESFLDSLVNMFAPSGSQRPNMTPVASA